MDLVYGVCLKYLDEGSAKDAVMQIFEELIVKVKQHDIQAFRGWLHVLARNHCLMKLRAAGTRGRIVAMEEEGFVESGPFIIRIMETGWKTTSRPWSAVWKSCPKNRRKA